MRSRSKRRSADLPCRRYQVYEAKPEHGVQCHFREEGYIPLITRLQGKIRRRPVEWLANTDKSLIFGETRRGEDNRAIGDERTLTSVPPMFPRTVAKASEKTPLDDEGPMMTLHSRIAMFVCVAGLALKLRPRTPSCFPVANFHIRSPRQSPRRRSRTGELVKSAPLFSLETVACLRSANRPYQQVTVSPCQLCYSA